MPHLLTIALHAAQLKRTPRTGWQRRGAPDENVAAHSFGVVFLTMLLLDAGEAVLDAEKALRMALLHDLAESLVGDLPRPVSRFIAPEIKHAAERAAFDEIVAELPQGGYYRALWEEYHQRESPEARLVKDADRLDMMIQAYLWEQQGQRNLQEFWQHTTSADFHTACARAIFMELLARRHGLFK